MSSDPEQLRREIEGTQRTLSADVDALTEKVTPSRIVHRRVDRARGAVYNLKDKIMGSVSSGTSTAGDKFSTAGDKLQSVAGSAADSTSSAASSVVETVQGTPQAVRRGTEGNPLAAGLIAFGAGWLVSSLIPASRQEQRLAGQVKQTVQDAAAPMADQVRAVAQDIQDNLREPAQQAVESVKSTAADAASTVTDQAKSAADDVKSTAQDAKGTVQGQASSSR